MCNQKERNGERCAGENLIGIASRFVGWPDDHIRLRRFLRRVRYARSRKTMLDGLPTRRVVAGEGEAAGLAVHPEDGDVVAALVAAVQEPAGRVEGEAARIVAARPFLADVASACRPAPTEKIADAVVQPVAGVDEPAVGRHQDLGAEVAAGEARRQGGDRLPRRSAGRSRRRSRTARRSSLPPESSRATGRWGGSGSAAARRRAAARPTAGRSGSAGPSRRRTSRRRSCPGPGRRAARTVPGGSAWIMWAWVRSWPLNGEAARRGVRRLGRADLAGVDS